MLTSHELFGFMSPALANDIITFTFENEKPTYRATLNAVAESRHVRGVFLERQPKANATPPWRHRSPSRIWKWPREI